MATDLALQPTAAAVPMPGAAMPDTGVAASGSLLTQLGGLPLRRKLILGAGLLVLAAIASLLLFMNSQGKYQLLYANLDDKDGGAVIAQLAQMNVPYKYAEGSSAILVPSDQVHDVRLKLAAAGLPKGSVTGFELMDNARFGITQFQERLNFQRGLEGELTRTITALAAVQDARVHLALPNQNGFFRDQQQPSASVMVALYPGRHLDRAQIAGIVHLVSSSVPNLSAKAVSVLDQNGSLLSESPDTPGSNELSENQLHFINRVETLYAQRIKDLLQPILGAENFRAQVTANFDFSRTDSTTEEYRPNQEPEVAAVRSRSQSSTMGKRAVTPVGVPGAASNQPAGPGSAPVNGPAQEMQVAGGNGAGDAEGHSESVTNYELDKTVRVTQGVAGTLKRLNAAVVVNYKTATDKDGKTVYEPLGDEELAKLTALVQEGIGFNTERGDSVKVIDAPFRVEEVEMAETPLWQQPEVLGLASRTAIPAVLLLLALVVLFGVVRPTLKMAAAGRRVHALVNDGIPAPQLPGAQAVAAPQLPVVEMPQNDNRIESIRNVARENPAVVANIVRGWVSNQGA